MNVATADRIRVLIIGDYAQSQQIGAELRRAGFQVLQAEAIQHALARAMDDAPNLVVLNAGTYPKDSMRLVSTMRDLVNVPIIMMELEGEMLLDLRVVMGRYEGEA